MEPRPVALVTAASRGMGAACARELAQRGYALALLARSEDVLALSTELQAVAVQGTVEQEADLKRLVETAMAKYGRVDAVVNNTGHAAKGELLDITDDQWHAGLDLLLLSVIRLARLVTPIMQGQGRGAFVNISSFAALAPDLQFSVSAAVRAALASFVKLFSQRYAGTGIRMNNVLPGYIETRPVKEENRRAIPAGRPGTTAEVAKTVAFLLSDDASYITGQNLLVDGGLVRSL